MLQPQNNKENKNKNRTLKQKHDLPATMHLQD
jgi:hypothetical protein